MKEIVEKKNEVIKKDIIVCGKEDEEKYNDVYLYYVLGF